MPAAARTLAVGPGREFARPSLAFAAAADGDTVLIEPGEYYDCGGWAVRGLTVAGTGPGVVLTDTTCAGKGILVVQGADATIRDLTLARARVPDGNGAGIRLEAPGLLLQRVRFDNDQVGVLSGAAGGELRIEDCVFERGGGGQGEGGGERPLYAVAAGEAGLLRIERSTFLARRGGQVLSQAQRTEIVGSTFEGGLPGEPAPVVTLFGYSALLEDNTFRIGPTAPRRAAVEGWGGGDTTLRGNRLLNATGASLTLLLDWTPETPVLLGNAVGPGDEAVSSRGLLRNRVSTFLHGVKDRLVHAGAWAVRRVRTLAGR